MLWTWTCNCIKPACTISLCWFSNSFIQIHSNSDCKELEHHHAPWSNRVSRVKSKDVVWYVNDASYKQTLSYRTRAWFYPMPHRCRIDCIKGYDDWAFTYPIACWNILWKCVSSNVSALNLWSSRFRRESLGTRISNCAMTRKWCETKQISLWDWIELTKCL